MYCQNCGMLKINCICGKYNKSDINRNENHEINEETKTDFSSDTVENESQVNSKQDKIQKTIKENFPFSTFLEDQLEILTEMVDAIEEGYKYIILESGVGKSAIAATLANIYKSSFILSDNEKLQEKYHEEYDLINNDKFYVSNHSDAFNEFEKLDKRKLLIVDDAHKFDENIADFFSCAIHLSDFDDELIDSFYCDVRDIENKEVDVWLDFINHLSLDDEKVNRVKYNIKENPDDWICFYDDFRDKKIVFKPLNLENILKKYLLNKAEICIFMSSTILNKEIFADEVGLDISEVKFVHKDFHFSSDTNQIYLRNCADMKNFKKKVKLVSPFIEDMLEKHKKEKGIIHTDRPRYTNYIKNQIDNPRLMFQNKKLNSDKEFTVLMKNNFFNDNIFDVIKMDSNTIESDVTKNKALVSDIEKQLNSILDLGYENKNYFKGDLKETQKEISFLNKNTQKLKDLYEYTHYLIDNNNENTKDIINLVKSKDYNLKCILPILKLNISNNLLKSIITKYPQLNKDNIEILINELSHVNKLNENLIDINRNRIVNLTVDRIDVDLIENNINQNDNLKKQFIDLTKLGPVNSKLYPVGRVLSDSCDIITKIKACFIVNPSMVPKYLDLNDFKSKFDYVIIDDPENMEINEIISALARGKHHVFVSKVNDNSKIKSINIKNKLLIRSLKHVDVDYGKLSSFDEVIYDLLTNKGVSVKKQVKSDKNRIDLAIYDKKKCKLEIESDDCSEYNKRLLTERFGLNKSDKYYKLWAFDWYHNIDEVEKTLFN